MPKFLLGRIRFYVTQVEAETEQQAISLLNANSARKAEHPEEANLPGVGETHVYQKAWAEGEKTDTSERVTLLTKEIAQLLSVIDHDGSRKALIHLPFENNGKTRPLNRPLGS